MRIILIILLGILGIHCNAVKKERNITYSSRVSLLINDSAIKLNNDFSVEVVLKGGKLPAKVTNDSLVIKLPKGIETERLTVSFTKSATHIVIDSVPGFHFTGLGKKDLIFGIADRAFFSELGLVLTKDSVLYKDTKTIFYLRIDPGDTGIGRVYKKYQ